MSLSNGMVSVVIFNGVTVLLDVALLIQALWKAKTDGLARQLAAQEKSLELQAGRITGFKMSLEKLSELERQNPNSITQPQAGRIEESLGEALDSIYQYVLFPLPNSVTHLLWRCQGSLIAVQALASELTFPWASPGFRRARTTTDGDITALIGRINVSDSSQ